MSTLCMKAPKLRGLKKLRPLHESTPPSSPLPSMEDIRIKEEPQDEGFNQGDPNTQEKSQPTENHNEKSKSNKFFTATLEYTGDMLVIASTSIRTLMRVTTIVTQQLEAKLIKIETSDKGEKSQETSFTEDQESSVMNHSISSLPENRKYSSKELLMLANSYLTHSKPKDWNKIRTEIPDIVTEEPEYINPDELGPLNDTIFLNARPSYENRNRRPMATISQNDEDLEHPYGRANTLQKDFGGYYMPAETSETFTLRNIASQNRNSNNNVTFSEINKSLEKDHSEATSLRNLGRQNSGNNNTDIHDSEHMDTEPVRDPNLRRASGNNNTQPQDSSEAVRAPSYRHPSGNNNTVPVADSEHVRYKVMVKEIHDVSPVRYEVKAEIAYDDITQIDRFDRTASERFQNPEEERWPHDHFNPENDVPLNFVPQPEKLHKLRSERYNGSERYQSSQRYDTEKWQHDKYQPDHRAQDHFVNTPNFFGGKFIHKSRPKEIAYVNSEKTISKYGLINDPLRVVDVNSFQ
ncbi:hypothetical protein LOTGIDRAFT_169702 [Lottia gigantea]|uniref:Uncharacterized protein n=1 Tax=Lottia gigantea TaxID=225164 RepID=V3ZG04_LOTGI|nr:hypothetical protein LOTGIDRAFT_169702 [Lottia gigantea]ESO83067.1 hypothetical protein LOTGIDRAFT_169702 [Lottia gigantea]